jgi:peptidoglycan hydrolase-like protein with peptidoglycan-binding domain
MLKSAVLVGNARLDLAASGGTSVKKAPPPDEPGAVRRIQKALLLLGFALPKSFPAGPSKEPDGQFGDETFQAVQAFQRREFPQDPSQWDGRCGKNTLGRMDDLLLKDSQSVSLTASQISTSRCQRV